MSTTDPQSPSPRPGGSTRLRRHAMLRRHGRRLLTAVLSLPVVCLGIGDARRAPPTAIRLRDLATRYRGALVATRDPETIRLVSRNDLGLLFTRNSRRLQAGSVLVWLNRPAERHGRTWSVGSADGLRTVAPLLAPSVAHSVRQRRHILLDPGHGGDDTGAAGPHGIKEKHLTLRVATQVRALLATQGVHATLTRESDQALSLRQRVAIARQQRADLFVSIHYNSAGNAAAAGVESFTVPAAGYPGTAAGSRARGRCPGNAHDADNVLLAYTIHRALLARTRQDDRGIKRARYLVLRDAPCPATLIECAFLSNAEEAEAIQSGNLLDRHAAGIAAGLSRYLAHPAGNDRMAGKMARDTPRPALGVWYYAAPASMQGRATPGIRGKERRMPSP